MIGRGLRARDPDARHVRRDRFGHLQRRCPARRRSLRFLVRAPCSSLYALATIPSAHFPASVITIALDCTR